MIDKRPKKKKSSKYELYLELNLKNFKKEQD